MQHVAKHALQHRNESISWITTGSIFPAIKLFKEKTIAGQWPGTSKQQMLHHQVAVVVANGGMAVIATTVARAMHTSCIHSLGQTYIHTSRKCSGRGRPTTFSQNNDLLRPATNWLTRNSFPVPQPTTIYPVSQSFRINWHSGNIHVVIHWKNKIITIKITEKCLVE